MGDFNFISQPSDRNKPRGNVNDMLIFNEAISNLGLIELPMKGGKFTCCNKQHDPLLKNWIGFLPQHPGQVHFLQHLFTP
jgi:hypothetical protein